MTSQVRARRLLRGASLALLTGALLPALPAAVPAALPSASAVGSTYLCTGYTPCARAGMPSAGYGAHNGRMYWRMYSGHNCTNYVAYRMIKAGMSTERPWSGTGMAYNWGLANSRITDSTPRVGAVAWWNRYDQVGSAGHVAYVEKVISSTEIIISEDSWSGDFHWRHLVKGQTAWPTGFVHFIDKTPPPAPPAKVLANTTKPRVIGKPQVGTALTAGRGAWKPAAGSFKLQWLADGVAVPGATRKTFVPGPDQVGRAISVQVTAVRSGYTSAVATSAASAPVTGGELAATAAPTLSGEGVVGSTLRAEAGAFSPRPDMTAFRWQVDGRTLKGQAGPSLKLDASMLGKTVTLLQIARLDGYERAVARAETTVGPVVKGVVQQVAPFALTGEARHGGTLAVTPGTVRPADAAVTYAWLRDGEPVDGATGTTYQVGGADVGHQLVLQVTVTKPDFSPIQRTFDAGVVTAAPVMRTGASGRTGAAAVAVHLRAPGLGKLDGPVTVRIGRRHVTTQVRDGFVRVLVDRLKAGRRKVVVTYEGTDVLDAARATTRVSVRR